MDVYGNSDFLLPSRYHSARFGPGDVVEAELGVNDGRTPQ